MIRKANTKLSLTRQHKLAKVNSSSIYYMQVGMIAETLKLMHEIDKVFTKYLFFGNRQIAEYPLSMQAADADPIPLVL